MNASLAPGGPQPLHAATHGADVSNDVIILERMLHAGLVLIPIPRGSKGPTIVGWNTRAACITDPLRAGELVGRNAGLAHAYSGTCAIDVDNFQASHAWLLKHGVNLANLLMQDDAVQVRSGTENRAKLLYRVDEALRTVRMSPGGAAMLEFRCATADGLTVQDVVYGTHPSGRPYRLLGDPAAIPKMPPALREIWQQQLHRESTNFPPTTSVTGFLLVAQEAELRDALTHIDADSREQWVEVGAALHVYGKQGFTLWLEWSQRSQKFNAADQWRVWNSFRDDRPGVTIRTLFAKAQARGWVNPLSANAGPRIDHALNGANKGTDSDPELLDLAQLAKTEPEEPRFIVYLWLPADGAALCAGHGGTSKSQIMLMFTVCIALGLPFYGHACERRKVLFYSAEDSREILHWRLAAICRALGVDLAGLDGWLFIFDATAAESICYTDAADPGARLTPRYAWLAAQVARREIGVVFIDGVADVFDASENDRSKVKAFVRACIALVKPQRGSVVLIGHVNRPTAANPKSAEGYAGTTGWHNAVRARWYLRAEVTEDGQPESGTCAPRILELQKSNYSPAGATLRLLWDAARQVYELEAAGGVVEAIRARNDRRMVLTLLAQCEALGRIVAVSEKANSNAGVMLGERQGFPASFRGKDGRKRLFRLLRQLEEDRLLRAETITTASRNRVDVWWLTDAGKQELAA